MGFDLFSGIAQAIGAPIAADQQKKAIHNAEDWQTRQYRQDQGYYQPYYDKGTAAFGNLYNNVNNGAYNVKVNPQNLANDPGYQFQLQQGQQALQRSAAAGGGLMSGRFMKGLDDYSQGLASTQYQNAWNREFQQNQFNYNGLANLAGMGMGSAGSLSGLGERYGNSMSSLEQAYGNAKAAGTMGEASGIGGSLDGAAGIGLTAATGMPGFMGGSGGGQSIPGQSPSASGLYAANPGGYSLGYGGGGGQSFGSIGYDSIPMQQQPSYGTGFGQYGGSYSLGDYGQLPPQMGGGY